MKTEAGTARREPPDPSLPSRLREFHVRLPLAGDPPNALLALPDDRILSLAAVLRDTPQAAPALSLEAWREFLDLLRPHGVYALLAYRLSAWPEGCRPPAEVMDF
ncbi:MAG TPA: nucleotidyltransferase family protein, partial [Methanoregulaceae archaeon]|nr:nucleotidyltransferase family protein [Methanoregulaceae archaeon]